MLRHAKYACSMVVSKTGTISKSVPAQRLGHLRSKSKGARIVIDMLMHFFVVLDIQVYFFRAPAPRSAIGSFPEAECKR